MQVSLGVLLKNENSNDDKLNIMHHFHQYVPMIEITEKVYIPGLQIFCVISNVYLTIYMMLVYA